MIATKAKSVLAPGLYEGDNGRLLCHECSGMTARATGRDRSGQRVIRVTDADATDWMQSFGEPMVCERCGVTHQCMTEKGHHERGNHA